MAEEPTVVRCVIAITPAQERWVAAYQRREGLTNRSEAFRDLLRKAMAQSGEREIVETA